MSVKRPHRAPVRYALGSPLGVPEVPVPHAPPVDVIEEPRGWRLVFEVPGAVADRTTVEILGRVVALRGERRPTEAEGGVFLRVERAPGPFERLVELPEEPDADGACAVYADGLLLLVVPRRPAPARREIPIHRTAARKGHGGPHGS